MADDLVLSMAEDEDSLLVDTPANLLVNVGNGVGSEAVTFTIVTATETWPGVDTITLDEYGSAQLAVAIPALLTGSYTLQAIGTVSTTAELDFGVTNDPLDDTGGTNADNPAAPTFDLGTTAWQLVDTTVGGDTYVFARNPARWTNPLKPHSIEYDVTTAPDGNVLAWEAGERPWTFEFSGYIDTQAEYEALAFWAGLRRRFWLVDHRHRLHYVTFEHFDAQARVVPNKPWAHDYTMRAVHFYRQNWDGEE